MEKVFSFFAIPVLVLAFAACTRGTDGPETSGPVAAQITSKVITKADGALWTQDRIGVTVQSDPDGTMAENYKNAGYETSSESYTADFSAITSDDVIYFDGSGEVTFTAYAPYVDNGGASVLPGDDGVISGNTLDQSDQTSLDYLYADEVTADEDNPTVSFAFSLMMSKLVLVIKARGGLDAEDIQGGSYTLGGLVHSGEFNVTTGATSLSSSSAEDLPLNDNCPADNTDTGVSYTAMVYPQTWSDPLTFSAIVGSYNYSTTLSEDFNNLQAGYTYTYVVTVSESGLTVGGSTVGDWEDGGTWYEIDLSNESGDVTVDVDGTVLTGGNPFTGHISFADGVSKVTFKNVNIACDMTSDEASTCAIAVNSDLALTVSGTNTVTIATNGSDEHECILVTGATLTIDGEGSLTLARADETSNATPGGALILSGTDANVVINGGAITAASGYKSAGIGGGSNAACGNITINGGTVTATSSGLAAGIGSGTSRTCGDITITGGTVSASNLNNQSGAGIGTGSGGSCGDIIISGGSVTALGGGQYSAAIGTGGNGKAQATCGDIIITSGVTSVSAQTNASNHPPYLIGPGCEDQSDVCGNVYLGGDSASDTSVDSWTTGVLVVTDNTVYGWTYDSGTWTKNQ